MVFTVPASGSAPADLLVGNFADDENREDPAVEVATPQVRDGAGRHDAVQRAGSADIPLQFGIREPQPETDRERRNRNR